MTFLIESTDPRAVLDDVLHDLTIGKHPVLLGLLLESKLAGIEDPFALADALSEDDLDALGDAAIFARLRVDF